MDCIKCNSCEKLGFHEWRFHCLNCKCPNYCHKSYAKSLDKDQQSNISWIDKVNTESHNQINDYQEALNLANLNNLVWLPIGIQDVEIPDFLQIWNENVQSRPLEKTPSNELIRTMLVLKQIPKMDWITYIEEKITDDDLMERIEQTFKKRRDANHLGFGEIEPVDLNDICVNCQKRFVETDKYSIRITHSATFSSHLSCFKCTKCEDMLVDFHYCWNNDKIYCLRDFGEITFSRCYGCDELIFIKDYTSAMDNEFHEEHFACHHCDTSLTGGRYILKNEEPYCVKCYEDHFGNTCERCNEKISCHSKDLSFNERHWHENCFHCEICKETLVDKTFATKENDVYCPNCFDHKFSTRCERCGEIFKSGIKKYDYGGKEWHDRCFLCGECNQTIGAKSFIPKNDKLICITCYEEKYAQKCSKCALIIRKGGVTYKGEPWHKECFLCTRCSKLLANTKFTTKDDKPYCTECFAELFSKRCKKCSKPISGFGGCKFISLEEDHWHTECFTCNLCEMSLVGKGFVTHNEKIICPDCGEKVVESSK